MRKAERVHGALLDQLQPPETAAFHAVHLVALGPRIAGGGVAQDLERVRHAPACPGAALGMGRALAGMAHAFAKAPGRALPGAVGACLRVELLLAPAVEEVPGAVIAPHMIEAEPAILVQPLGRDRRTIAAAPLAARPFALLRRALERA